MELPDIGKHCSKDTCKRLDFLPVKCDFCSEMFCDQHYYYTQHDCSNAYLKNNQVPVCPLCNKPIPVATGQEPNRVVGRHIDNDCQSDPAKEKRKVFTNRCTLKGCRGKEVIPLVCNECGLNFCLKHRHPLDHQCEGSHRAKSQNKLVTKLPEETRAYKDNSNALPNGNISEDEAFARALALSMQDTSNLTQEQLDQALARQLQESEYQDSTGRNAASNRSDRCVLA